MEEKIRETLDQLEELLEKEASLLAGRIELERSDELERAQKAITQLLNTLHDEIPSELASRRVAVQNKLEAEEEDHRERLHRETQATLYPGTELYRNDAVLRLYK